MKTTLRFAILGVLGVLATGCTIEDRHASYHHDHGYSATGFSSSPAPVYQSQAPTYSESTTELVQPVASATYAAAPPPVAYESDPRHARHYEHEREHFVVPANVTIGATTPQDQIIANDIVRRAVAAGAIQATTPKIRVAVHNGKVHLEGRLIETAQHRALKEIARSTPGVRDIEDDLHR